MKGHGARLQIIGRGPEFISKALDLWPHMNGVTLDFSRPGNADVDHNPAEDPLIPKNETVNFAQLPERAKRSSGISNVRIGS